MKVSAAVRCRVVTMALISATSVVSVSSASGARTAAPTQSERTRVPCSNTARIATWHTARLAAETLAAGGSENAIPSLLHEEQIGIGGIVLFGNTAPLNMKAQLRALNSHALDGIVPFFMTDEEGGAVQRMANLVGQVPAARVMGETMTPRRIETLALGLGRRLLAAGVTMDLAPVLDIDGGVGPNARNPDGTRSFSPNASLASADGVAFAEGLQRGGVIAVAKHFPGLGGSTGNTDNGPAATPSWSSLERAGLLPFRAAINAGIDAVMVANATVPGLTRIPASLSSTVVTRVLRRELGFRGLIMTDALSALAIRGEGLSIPQAAVEALVAGEDLLLYQAPTTSPDALTNEIIATIVRAVTSGALLRSRLVDAVEHVLAAKHVDLCPLAKN